MIYTQCYRSTVSYRVLFFRVISLTDSNPAPLKSGGIAAKAVTFGKHLPSTNSRQHEQKLVGWECIIIYLLYLVLNNIIYSV